MKVDVERFGCNNLLQDFKFMKNVKVVMDVFLLFHQILEHFVFQLFFMCVYIYIYQKLIQQN